MTIPDKCEVLIHVDRMLDTIAEKLKLNPNEDGPLGGGLGDEIYNLVVKRIEKHGN